MEGKACHVKSEMPIRYASGTARQGVRKMNLELRWDVRLEINIRETSVPDGVEVMGLDKLPRKSVERVWHSQPHAPAATVRGWVEVFQHPEGCWPHPDHYLFQTVTVCAHPQCPQISLFLV